ncbi:uncharacterized protein LOC135397753 [Ornithodoros turicata]|uniref:uncharacterized protein LOC135397753 n=1 Tax=Ornithodoros turicata TaxID=34597 RepID=UPI00313A34FB
MQQGSIVKPVRFLTRKHVFPTNLEKMNVMRAVQVLSPPVTAALKLLEQQAGHTCDASFSQVGETVEFMDTMHRWFLLMDVSNCTQHIHQNYADTKQYLCETDERLEWLESTFLEYLGELKSQCHVKNFLTKETYEGLLLTTRSNVDCTRYLLRVMNFGFVLTRKMSSDPIESFFGWLRKTAGSNDQTDVRAVLSGIEKTLKTGIASTSRDSNVVAEENHPCSSGGVPMSKVQATDRAEVEQFPTDATRALIYHLERTEALAPTPEVAALAMVGGYLARVISETIACEQCTGLVQKPDSLAPSDALIKHQDRGGLFYPSQQLLVVLHCLKIYIQVMLAKRRNLKHPLKAAVEHATAILSERQILKCSVPGHHRQFLEVLLTKFFRPLFTNFALGVTDKYDMAKIFTSKPLSRKPLKL